VVLSVESPYAELPYLVLPDIGDDPSVLRSVADRIDVVGRDLNRTGADLSAVAVRLAQGWSGSGAAGCQGRIHRLVTRFTAGSGLLGEVAGAIRSQAAVLEATRVEVARLRDRWAAQERGGAPGGAAALAVEIQRRWAELSTEAEAATGRIEAALVSGVLTVPVSRSTSGWESLTSGQQDFYSAVALTSPVGFRPGSPDRVKDQWAQIDPALRQALLRSDPHRWGSMNGLPAADRDLANRLALAADLAAVDPVLVRAGIDTSTDPGVAENAELLDTVLLGSGMSTSQVAAARGSLAVRHGLAQAAARVGPAVPVQLLVYEPDQFGGHGRAAVALGDVATADNVALLVPGMNSDVPGYLDNQLDNAGNLFDRARVSAPAMSTAVVAAVDYQAPGGDVSVTRQHMAAAGGPWVVSDLAGLAAARHTPAHVTVIGHSYGSTTVAQAMARDGGRADDVVLIGSPGVGTGVLANQFGPGADHVWVGSASSDPVTTVFENLQAADDPIEVGVIAGADVGRPLGPGGVALGGLVGAVSVAAGGQPARQVLTPVVDADLGQDPAMEVFGGRRFHAETASDVQLDFANHSRYYEVGSESLANIASVVTGDYGAVGEAPPRSGDGEHYLWSDPEAGHEPGG